MRLKKWRRPRYLAGLRYLVPGVIFWKWTPQGWTWEMVVR
jgi:hypothetical protein